MPARYDLHTHSTCSDGTDSVDALIAAARTAGLDAIALTDHDTTSGWDAAVVSAPRHGVDVVRGIEVSTQQHGVSVHVLALLPGRDEASPLRAEIARARRSRLGRAQEMTGRIGEDHPITWEDVQAQVAGTGTTIGRPHIADALVAAGVVADRDEAFAGILAADSPYYVPYYAPSPAVAVRAIRASGGVSVIAHPASASRGGTPGVDEDLLEELIAEGLDGIEVDHRENDVAARSRLRGIARRHGLIETGGSDYHGRGKPNRLGENLTTPENLEAIISRSTSGTEVVRG